MRWFLFLAFLPVSFFSFAQNAIIKKVEIAGDRVIVYYDLEDSNAKNEYLLALYSSKDNYAAPLTKVKGDVGSEIKPGSGKKIEWNIREELPGYKGRITLEVRGKVYLSFIKLQDFDLKKTYKRGKQYNITWKAGGSNPLNVELFKGDLRVVGDMNQPNSGTYTLNIPPKAKKGKDYRLKISDSKNKDEVIYTGYFKVAPKIPAALKIIAGLAIVGGGAFAATAGGGGGESGPAAIPLPGFPSGN